MQQTGKVLEVADGYALVQFQRTKACGNCNACMSLGDGMAAVRIRNTLDARPGDQVHIQLHANSFLKATAIAYGVPLLGLLVGVILGALISDIAAICMGLGFAALAFVLLKLLEKKFSRMQELKPRMITIENTRERE